jgi:hypothetical protein
MHIVRLDDLARLVLVDEHEDERPAWAAPRAREP